jgi:hypothetical protein
MLKKLFTHALVFWLGGCVALFGIATNLAIASDSVITVIDLVSIASWPYNLALYFWSLV